MSLDLGFLCSIIAVAHIQSVESFGSTAFYFSFLNILFKFSCSPQTNILLKFHYLGEQLRYFSCQLSVFIVENIL